MADNILAQVPLFAGVPPAELDQLLVGLSPCHMPAGTVLLREGDCGDHFYVVISGHVDIIKSLGTSDERLVTTRGPGEFLGEMSLLNGDGRRTASVRVRAAAHLLEMRRADFDRLLHRYPRLAYEMVRVMSYRLTESQNRIVADLHVKNAQLQTAYDALQTAQAQLIAQETLARELRLAHDLQMGLLPQTRPLVPGYSFGAQVVPARAVGGDLFDFVPLGPLTVGLVIGDVADKGMPAAIFMAQALALLRAEAGQGAAPAQVLRRVNRHLLYMNRSELFVTVFYGVLDLTIGRLDYARAGHEVPLLLEAGRPPRRLPRGRGQPLGVFEDVELDEGTLSLPPQGTLLCFSDGVPDARRPDGEAYGSARLQDALAAEAAPQDGAQPLCDRLLQRVMTFQAHAPQHDDIALLAVQRRA
ncbi:MAG: SpoIIE family protein phosphatase [Anaerolineales bacterium]|nr:SpoIIE family protein phosphatase [Anaerolineales bacterium]